MAKKKPEPILTYTEVLCYAINYLEQRIREIRDKVDHLPEAEAILGDLMSRELRHLVTLKTLYTIEVGVEYD